MDLTKCTLQHGAYMVFRDVGLDSVMAIFRHRIKNIEVKSVLQDSLGRGPQYQQRPPGECVLPVIQVFILNNEQADFWKKSFKNAFFI